MSDERFAFLNSGQCNMTALRMASRRAAMRYDQAVAPCGLNNNQFSILATLGWPEGAPPTIQQLGHALVMDRSTIGQNLRPLEREGLLALLTGSEDRRARLVSLTPQGRERLRQAIGHWERAQQAFDRSLGSAAAASLRATLYGIATTPVV